MGRTFPIPTRLMQLLLISCEKWQGEMWRRLRVFPFNTVPSLSYFCCLSSFLKPNSNPLHRQKSLNIWLICYCSLTDLCNKKWLRKLRVQAFDTLYLCLEYQHLLGTIWASPKLRASFIHSFIQHIFVYCVLDLEAKTVIKMDKVHLRAQRTPSLESNNKLINKSL